MTCRSKTRPSQIDSSAKMDPIFSKTTLKHSRNKSPKVWNFDSTEISLENRIELGKATLGFSGSFWNLRRKIRTLKTLSVNPNIPGWTAAEQWWNSVTELTERRSARRRIHLASTLSRCLANRGDLFPETCWHLGLPFDNHVDTFEHVDIFGFPYVNMSTCYFGYTTLVFPEFLFDLYGDTCCTYLRLNI